MPKLELDLPYTEEGEALASLLEQQIPGVRRVAPANQGAATRDEKYARQLVPAAQRSYPTPPPVPAGAQPQDWRTNPRGVPSDPRGAQNLPSVVGPDGQRQPRGGRIPGVTLPGGVSRRIPRKWRGGAPAGLARGAPGARGVGGGFNVAPTTGPTGEPLTPARRPPIDPLFGRSPRR